MTAADELDALIATAASTQDKGLFAAALKLLDTREVFYRAVVTPTEDGQRVSTPLARLSDGSHAFVVYTSKDHPELPKKFGGAPWRHVLSMAAGLPQADWLIVSTAGGAWLPIRKDQIGVIIQSLEKVGTQGEGSGNGAPKSKPEELDTLIADAQGASSEDWSEPLSAALRDRELFVRLSSDRLENGRPVLVTSVVGDVSGLVQVHTSRSRPGITYGGMSWDDIVNLVRDSPDLTGVHIVNDNDDWVVLGESEL